MTPAQNAAAMYGLATNTAIPLEDRLGCALQALEFYANLDEVERDKLSGHDEAVVVGHVPVVPEEAPQGWKDLIQALAIMSQNASTNYPTHCEHDELTMCGVDPHKFTRDELFVLDQLGFFVSGHVGFKKDGSLDEDYDGEGTVWDCRSDYCEAGFKSYRYGSA